MLNRVVTFNIQLVRPARIEAADVAAFPDDIHWLRHVLLGR